MGRQSLCWVVQFLKQNKAPKIKQLKTNFNLVQVPEMTQGLSFISNPYPRQKNCFKDKKIWNSPLKMNVLRFKKNHASDEMMLISLLHIYADIPATHFFLLLSLISKPPLRQKTAKRKIFLKKSKEEFSSHLQRLFVQVAMVLPQLQQLKTTGLI